MTSATRSSLSPSAAVDWLPAPGPRRSALAAAGMVALALTVSPGTTPLSAQERAGARQDALHVFLDCNTFRCDSEYFRTDIDFVNWVRDRTLAQVHLIVTSQQTGGGGQVFILDFIGREELEDDDDQLQVTTPSTATEAEQLEVITGAMAAGLARYSAAIGQPVAYVITGADRPEVETGEIVSADEVDDPWNFWVFEVGADLDVEGEESERERRYSADFEASRTTETWKFELDARGSTSRDERDFEDRETVVDERTNWNTDFLLAYTLADHWSLGTIAGAGASTRRNQDFGADAAVALEYSFFPYVEAPRRSLTARYDLRVQYFDWEDETIFMETSETRPQHELNLQLFQRQPWGELRASLEGSQFLHDLGLWSASLSGGLEFRIFRGLNLDVNGDISLIEDQLFISAEGLTDEEILLGRFERPTDFTYEFRMGLSFEFGSIFNNVVNNRFDSLGFGGF